MIAVLVLILTILSPLAAIAQEDKDVIILKLRLQLNDEKRLTNHWERNFLLIDRKNICAELAGKDPKTHAELCKEDK
jgi:hypothetical protein